LVQPLEIDNVEITPLDFLEAVYCNPNLPLATRLRAAIEAAPYRHPKLAVSATATINREDLPLHWTAPLKDQERLSPSQGD
jgi:hypothetical protein